MKRNYILVLSSLFLMSTMSAARLTEVVKEDKGRYLSSSSYANKSSVDQMLDQVQTRSSDSGKSRQDLIQEVLSDDEQSIDAETGKVKKKKPGFFDRLSSAHKVAMAVAGLAALTGIAGAAWKFKDAIGEFAGIKKLMDSFKDTSLSDLNEGLNAPQKQLEEIKKGDNQMKKLGVELQQGREALKLLNELGPEIKQALPKVNRLLSNAEEIKPAVIALVRGMGVPDDQLKTDGLYDLAKATEFLGKGFKAGNVNYGALSGALKIDLSNLT